MTHRFSSALITGATSGIGAAFARVLPADTDLLLVARNEEKLGASAAALKRPDREVATVAADLTTDEGRRAVIERAEGAEVDLLINNAGVGALGRIIDHDPERVRATVELNVTTPVVLTRALLPGMLARAYAGHRRAGVIFLSSQVAFAPVPYFTTYTATKAFDLVFAEGLAEEMRREPVDVLALCPGATKSEFGRRAGYARGNLPGAIDPETVARDGLKALGRHTVYVPGFGGQTAFAPLVLPRRLAATGIGAIMGLVSDRFTRRPPSAS
ncbi:MAG TPA: SDR family NAD(P)-dependent oxidoreductase [Geminicoccaceae bacterium]|nr:SDR family NAD(P)-dependent oxidoreductase [Geminicoccaceae bacterium]